VEKNSYIIGLLLSITVFASLLASSVFNNVSGQEKKVVATVNGEKIYSQEVEKRLEHYKGMDPSMLSGLRQEIVDELVVRLLIGQFLRKEGVSITAQEVEQAISNVRERMKANPKTATFTLEDLLESSGSSLEELRGEIKTSLGLKTHFERVTGEETLRNYFLANKEIYGGEMVRASHILVDTRLMSSQEELARAKQKIDDVKKKLNGGADFAELAKQFSDCPSSEKGGDIGFFPRKGAVVETFAQTAFKLKPGEVSDPVKTEFGYHIIKVTEKKEAKKVEYNDVQEQVKENYFEEETGRLLQRLRQEAKVEIMDK
jgi:parvulin-like peptidyl-prolyl isomerase